MSLTHPVGRPSGLPLDLPENPLWRWTVDKYHEMIRKGVFSDEDRVELLEGVLVTKMIKNPPHREATELARHLLERLAPEGWHVMSQEPVTLATSEPEPDVTVVRGGRRDYHDRHPGPGDVGLVVEVADASLERDRSWKRRLYAEAGIPVYWIVNLLERRLEVHADPSGPASCAEYGSHQAYDSDGHAPLAIDGRHIAQVHVRDLLP
jgi:Uma2 family endonuclease